MNPKTIVLLALALASFLNGAALEYFRYVRSHFSPIEIWLLVGIFVFLVFLWYRLDTDQRAYRRTLFLSVGVIFLSVIALPYYFFRSRGIKGGFIYCGFFVLAMLCSHVLTVAGQFATHYMLQS
jgi:hypothetical protein